MGTPFEGPIRKVVIVFIALTAISWLLVVIGFAVGSNEDKDDDVYVQSGINDKDEPDSYPLWIVSFTGPFLIVAAVLHAALWRPWNSIFGAIASFLSIFFVTGLGMILYYNGSLTRRHIKGDDEVPELPEWFSLEFVAAFLATVFWTIVIVLWHFFDICVTPTYRAQE